MKNLCKPIPAAFGSSNYIIFECLVPNDPEKQSKCKHFLNVDVFNVKREVCVYQDSWHNCCCEKAQKEYR